MTHTTRVEIGVARKIRKAHDARSYFRLALALVAPIPMAVAAATMYIFPFGLDDEFETGSSKPSSNPGAAAGWRLGAAR